MTEHNPNEPYFNNDAVSDAVGRGCIGALKIVAVVVVLLIAAYVGCSLYRGDGS